jgi:hypothetical protein
MRLPGMIAAIMLTIDLPEPVGMHWAMNLNGESATPTAACAWKSRH